jgi:ABC-type transport system, involved in lipoprotein release, permease component
VKQEIQQFLDPPQYAQTWIDMNRQYFEAVRLERTVMFFLLFFIVIVAAFGIMSTLITVTVQKRHEIGIVKALGANIAQIVWVFLGQGTIVGLFGTITGLGLGMTLIRYRTNSVAGWHRLCTSRFSRERSINSRRSRPKSFRMTLLSSVSAPS